MAENRKFPRSKMTAGKIPFLLLLLCYSTLVFSEELDVISTLKQLDEPAVSILFLIDHSGSMSGSSTNNPGQDRWGERFKVAFALVDSIVKLFDSAEVAVVIFRKYLYYDPADDSRFAQCPEQDTGAYLPLFKLDSSYAPDGKMGYQIVKEYLDYDTVSSGSYAYVDLKYRPSNVSINGGNTNITAGFHAAKDAFRTARYPKERQFIIFFSDGVATYPGQQGSPEANQYIEDVKAGIPTTFTIYFTQNSSPPQDLVDMTNNVKVNNYSVMNDSSALWAIDLGTQTLMDFLLDNILTIIIDEKTPKIIPYSSPTYNRRPTLTWHPPQEPCSSYTIQVAAVSDFSTPVVNVPVVDTFYTTQLDLPFGTIYWRVKSNISNWSKVSSFLLLDNRVPVLIPHESPTQQVQPILTWHRPPGSVSVYTIQVSSVHTFDPVILETPVLDTFYTCQTPLPYGTIYWRVKGDDSDYSTPGNFLIDSATAIVKASHDLSNVDFACNPMKNRVRILLPGLNGAEIQVDIFNVNGKIINSISQNHSIQDEIVWDYKDTSGKNVSSGIYLIRVKAGNKIFLYKVPVSR